MLNVLYVIIGGAVGALCRYGMGELVKKISSGHLPWPTLVVNIIGSLIIGFSFHFSQHNLILERYKLLVFTGFLGAFTTFSSYSLESINLLRAGFINTSLLYIIIMNTSCLFATAAGIYISSSIRIRYF